MPEEEPDARETQRAIKAEGRRCLLLPGDVTSRKFCEEAVNWTVKKFGRLDILVSNAAYQTRKKTLQVVTDHEFDRTFKTNIYAYFWFARAALKHMKAGAAIIATSSVTGIKGSKELPDYSATKGAINAFTKALAMSVLEKGIRVNAVAPGRYGRLSTRRTKGCHRRKSRSSAAGIRWADRRSRKSSRPRTSFSLPTPILPSLPAPCSK